jgi:creatinine amidohydrolase/Fe(II)-dependent formamide hydrolase-like protein
MMLAAQPALVDMERAEPGRSDDEFYLPENVGRSQMDAFIYGLQTQSPNGVLGDPVGSTADVGEELLSAAAESLAEIFRTAPSG